MVLFPHCHVYNVIFSLCCARIHWLEAVCHCRGKQSVRLEWLDHSCMVIAHLWSRGFCRHFWAALAPNPSDIGSGSSSLKGGQHWSVSNVLEGSSSPPVMWLLQVALGGIGPKTLSRGFQQQQLDRWSAVIRFHPSLVVPAHLWSRGFYRHFLVALGPKPSAVNSGSCCDQAPHFLEYCQLSSDHVASKDVSGWVGPKTHDPALIILDNSFAW